MDKDSENHHVSSKKKLLIIVAIVLIIGVGLYNGGIGGLMKNLKPEVDVNGQVVQEKLSQAQDSTSAQFELIELLSGLEDPAASGWSWGCKHGENSWRRSDGFANQCSYSSLRAFNLGDDWAQSAIEIHETLESTGLSVSEGSLDFQTTLDTYGVELLPHILDSAPTNYSFEGEDEFSVEVLYFLQEEAALPEGLDIGPESDSVQPTETPGHYLSAINTTIEQWNSSDDKLGAFLLISAADAFYQD